ncbi:MAG: hypothetical protein ACRDO9_02735 [Gaiellales bacterium]|jgi:hypothetical protein
MTRRIIILGALMAMAAVPAAAQSPAETPFPSAKIAGTFVRVRTVTAPNSAYLTNFFPQGAPVAFRMFVGDNKTGHSLTNKDLRYAKIVIPGQPALKMTYAGDDPLWPWVGTWTIPAGYPLGIVAFQAEVKTKTNKYGGFVQMPVGTSQLTVTAS